VTGGTRRCQAGDGVKSCPVPLIRSGSAKKERNISRCKLNSKTNDHAGAAAPPCTEWQKRKPHSTPLRAVGIEPAHFRTAVTTPNTCVTPLLQRKCLWQRPELVGVVWWCVWAEMAGSIPTGIAPAPTARSSLGWGRGLGFGFSEIRDYPTPPTSSTAQISSHPVHARRAIDTPPQHSASTMSSVSKLSLSPFSVPSPTLAHLNRMLSTTSGQDKPLMLISCKPPKLQPLPNRVIKLVVLIPSGPVTDSSHIISYFLRHPAGFPTKAKADIADRVQKFGAAVGDARVL